MTRFSRPTTIILLLPALAAASIAVVGCSHQAAPAASAPSVSVNPNQTPQMQQAMASHASGEMTMARKRGEMMKRMRENQKGPQ